MRERTLLSTASQDAMTGWRIGAASPRDLVQTWTPCCRNPPELLLGQPGRGAAR
jgi:hypothetical protein